MRDTNRVDHQAEALQMLANLDGDYPGWRSRLTVDQTLALVQIHVGFACIPDSVAGALDARRRSTEGRSYG